MWQDQVNEGIAKALKQFLTEPTGEEARNAAYSALVEMMEIECRRRVAEHMKLEMVDGRAEAVFEGPLAQVLRDLFGINATGNFGGDVSLTVPGWTPPTESEVIQMTRPYLDPLTKRPTRGRPQ